jgi:hypothetical protein
MIFAPVDWCDNATTTHVTDDIPDNDDDNHDRLTEFSMAVRSHPTMQKLILEQCRIGKCVLSAIAENTVTALEFFNCNISAVEEDLKLLLLLPGRCDS